MYEEARGAVVNDRFHSEAWDNFAIDQKWEGRIGDSRTAKRKKINGCRTLEITQNESQMFDKLQLVQRQLVISKRSFFGESPMVMVMRRAIWKSTQLCNLSSPFPFTAIPSKFAASTMVAFIVQICLNWPSYLSQRPRFCGYTITAEMRSCEHSTLTT